VRARFKQGGGVTLHDFDSLIEFVLRNASTIKKCVEIKRLESVNGGGHTGGGTSGHSRISDPTALQAIRSVEPVSFIQCPYGAMINGKRDERYIKLPEKWLKVEELTRGYYAERESDDEKTLLVKEIYTRRYLNGEYGEKWDRTCADLKISHGIYYAVVRDVVRFAGLYAAGYGLIPPYSRF
jgi:hypothetical protein